MPKRGERRRDFAPEPDDSQPVPLGGLWVFEASTPRGRSTHFELDTTAFVCRRLADELAAELVDYVRLLRPSPPDVSTYRRAVLGLCAFVDRSAGPGAAEYSLAQEEPDTAAMIRAWWQSLPGSYREGSTQPYMKGVYLLALIKFRGQHPERPLASAVQRLTTKPVPLDVGASKELPEFSRADRDQLVRAAWAHIRELKQRLQHGRDLVAAGADPRTAGWLASANLAFGLKAGLVTPEDIWAKLPAIDEWPTDLLELRSRISYPSAMRLTDGLVALLYPVTFDLHPFRVLLVAATGHAPEELTSLTEDDVDFVPGGVRLRLVKHRAHKARTREFRAQQDETETMHSDKASTNVSELLRTLLDVTADTRARSTARSPYLFTSAENTLPKDELPGGELIFEPFETQRRGSSFPRWVNRRGLAVSGKTDIRRLRKSTKVEKVIAFRGTVSDAADDHTEQVFWGHYAHGTTLRVMAGRTITTAQETWLARALEGPVVLASNAAQQLEQPEVIEGLGLSTEQAEEIRQGELDMGVSSCRDPYDSPYSSPGELCAVAPLRCLECRNAFVLPSNLPQLLLFADHLDNLAARLDPRIFHQTWGQSRTNLRAVLADIPESTLTHARQQIEQQSLRLQLPLAAQAEFES